MNLSLNGIGWRVSTDTVVMSALVIGDAWNFMSGCGPSYFTTAEFAASDDPEKRKRGAMNIRRGYRLASAQALLVGGAITLYTKSWLPLAASCLAIGVAVAMYEHALSQKGGGVGIASQ